MPNMEWSDWLLLFAFPLLAVGGLALLGLVVVPVFFVANLVVGYLIGEKRHMRDFEVTGGLKGFAGVMGWWSGASLAAPGPYSLLLALIALLDAGVRQREGSLKLLLAAAIGMVFAIIGLCLMRMSNKDEFKISWPAVHSPGSARRRAVLMHWVIWDWLPTTTLAMFVMICLPLIVEMPEQLSSNHGQPTGTQFAIAAVIGAVWATFNLLTPKSRRILDEAAAELRGNEAGVSAGTIAVTGGEDAPAQPTSAIKRPHQQPERPRRAARLSSKPTRVLH